MPETTPQRTTVHNTDSYQPTCTACGWKGLRTITNLEKAREAQAAHRAKCPRREA